MKKEKEKKYGLFCYYKNGEDFEHLEGWDEFGDDKKEMIEMAGQIAEIECWHDDWSEPSTILIEIWENDGSGMWGNTGAAIYKKEFTAGK